MTPSYGLGIANEPSFALAGCWFVKQNGGITLGPSLATGRFLTVRLTALQSCKVHSQGKLLKDIKYHRAKIMNLQDRAKQI